MYNNLTMETSTNNMDEMVDRERHRRRKMVMFEESSDPLSAEVPRTPLMDVRNTPVSRIKSRMSTGSVKSSNKNLKQRLSLKNSSVDELSRCMKIFEHFGVHGDSQLPFLNPDVYDGKENRNEEIGNPVGSFSYPNLPVCSNMIDGNDSLRDINLEPRKSYQSSRTRDKLDSEDDDSILKGLEYLDQNMKSGELLERAIPTNLQENLTSSHLTYMISNCFEDVVKVSTSVDSHQSDNGVDCRETTSGFEFDDYQLVSKIIDDILESEESESESQACSSELGSDCGQLIVMEKSIGFTGLERIPFGMPSIVGDFEANEISEENSPRTEIEGASESVLNSSDDNLLDLSEVDQNDLVTCLDTTVAMSNYIDALLADQSVEDLAKDISIGPEEESSSFTNMPELECNDFKRSYTGENDRGVMQAREDDKSFLLQANDDDSFDISISSSSSNTDFNAGSKSEKDFIVSDPVITSLTVVSDSNTLSSVDETIISKVSERPFEVNSDELTLVEIVEPEKSEVLHVEGNVLSGLEIKNVDESNSNGAKLLHTPGFGVEQSISTEKSDIDVPSGADTDNNFEIMDGFLPVDRVSFSSDDSSIYYKVQANDMSFGGEEGNGHLTDREGECVDILRELSHLFDDDDSVLEEVDLRRISDSLNILNELSKSGVNIFGEEAESGDVMFDKGSNTLNEVSFAAENRSALSKQSGEITNSPESNKYEMLSRPNLMKLVRERLRENPEILSTRLTKAVEILRNAYSEIKPLSIDCDLNSEASTVTKPEASSCSCSESLKEGLDHLMTDTASQTELEPVNETGEEIIQGNYTDCVPCVSILARDSGSKTVAADILLNKNTAKVSVESPLELSVKDDIQTKEEGPEKLVLGVGKKTASLDESYINANESIVEQPVKSIPSPSDIVSSPSLEQVELKVNENQLQLVEFGRKKVEELESQLERERVKTSNMEGRVKDLERQCTLLEKERLKAEINFEKELRRLKIGTVEKVNQSDDEENLVMESMTEEFDGMMLEVGCLIKQKDCLKEMLNRVLKTTKESLSGQARLFKDYSTLLQNNKDLDGKLSVAETNNERHQQYVEELENLLQRTNANIQDLHTLYGEEIESQKSQVSSMSKDLENITLEKQSLCQSLESHVEELKQSVERLEVERQTGAEQLEDANFLLEHQKETNRVMNVEMERLRKVEAEWAVMKASLKDLQDELDFLDDDRKEVFLDYTVKLEKATNRCNILQQTQEHLQKDLDTTKEQLLAAQSDTSSLLSVLEAVETKADSLLDSLRQKFSTESAASANSSGCQSASKPHNPQSNAASSFVARVLSSAMYLENSSRKADDFDNSALKPQHHALTVPHNQCVSYHYLSSKRKNPSSRKALDFSSPVIPSSSESNKLCQPIPHTTDTSVQEGNDDTSLRNSITSTAGFAHVRSIPVTGIKEEKRSLVYNPDEFNATDICEYLVESIEQKFSLVMKLARTAERSFRMKMRDLRGEIELLSGKCNKKQDRIQRIELDLDNKKRSLDEARAENNNLSERVDQMVAAILKHEDRSYDLKRLEEDNVDLKIEVDALVGERNMLTNQVQTLIAQTNGGTEEKAYLKRIAALEKRNYEHICFSQQEHEKNKAKGEKAMRTIRVLETNLKLAEEEVCKFDELVEAIRRTCIEHRTMRPHPALLHVVRLIDGLVEVTRKPADGIAQAGKQSR